MENKKYKDFEDYLEEPHSKEYDPFEHVKPITIGEYEDETNSINDDVYDEKLEEAVRERVEGVLKTNRRKRILKSLFVGVLAGAAIAGMDALDVPVVENVKDDISFAANNVFYVSDINETLKPYEDILTQETYGPHSGEYFWYNQGNIASRILDTEDVEYGVYYLHKNLKDSMDENNQKISKRDSFCKIFNLMSQYDINNDILGGDYANIEEYLVSKGFVTKDGLVDYEGWEKSVVDRIIFEHKTEKTEDSISRRM